MIALLLPLATYRSFLVRVVQYGTVNFRYNMRYTLYYSRVSRQQEKVLPYENVKKVIFSEIFIFDGKFSYYIESWLYYVRRTESSAHDALASRHPVLIKP